MIYLIVSIFEPSMKLRITCYSSKEEYLKHYHLSIKHMELDKDYNYSFFKFPLLGINKSFHQAIAKTITKGCLGDSISELAYLIYDLKI